VADWTNLDITKPLPEQDSTEEDQRTAVLPDPKPVSSLTEIDIGPKQVFPKGYPTTRVVRNSITQAGRHMNNVTLKPEELIAQAVRLKMTKDVQFLEAHGVADATKIHAALYPEGQDPIRSLAAQDMFLVTADFKVIDVAAYSWPINLEAAVDVRTQLMQPVQYGDSVGVVARGINENMVLIRSKQTFLAPIQDLEPLMVDKKFRAMISGGT